MTGLTARNLFAAFLLPFVVVFSVGSLSAAGVASEISPARHIGWWGAAITTTPQWVTYIAFADGEVAAEDGNGKLTVRKYESGVWTTVGPAMFTSGPIKWPSIACDSSGTPYVAYRDDSVGEGVTVKKFNGTSWVQVGSGMIAETVRRISIGIGSDNLPAVVYYNESWWGDYPQGAIMMQKFNGTSWVIVGNPTVSDSGWGEEKGYPTLRYNPSGTTPYVAYVDGDGDGPLVVRKFNGTSWETVGNAGFTPDNGHSPSIAFGPDGLPYVAYITNGGAPGVMRFNGTSWHDVGEQFFDSEVASEGLSLVVDSSGTPYLAYIGYGDAKLVKFDQDSGSWVSASGEYSLVYGSSYSISSSASMDSDGNIYFFIADDTNYRVFKVSDSGWAPPPVGTVKLAIPSSASFPSCLPSSSPQTLNVSVGQISVADTKMSSAGYYVTVSSSALSSGGNSISSANVSGNVAGATVSTLSGTTNSSVTVPGAIGSGYTPLNNATTLLQRSGGGGVSGTYGVNLGLRVLIPAYTPAGSYSGIVTFTLIEN